MADEVVGAGSVKLHHALHGYAEGHRELASSLQLKPRDAKTVLVLSDVSGPGARIDEAGYLTGYPLADAGLYAFSRTWAAPEMPRPGCVWTHTLLIDFADLARLGTLTDLLAAFRRPLPSGHADYTKPLLLECAAEAPRLEKPDELRARRIMAALYGKPKARVIASREAHATAEVLVTALWSQQWPRLRRSFRFCTLAVTDRSTEGAGFDLQLLPPGNQALRTRFAKAMDADGVAAGGEWLDEAVDDLIRPRLHGLRGFLRQIGGDVSGGRAAFAPLCKLYRLTGQFGTDPHAVVDAIGLLHNELGAAQARAARTIVAAAAAVEAERLDSAGIDYVLAHLDLIDPARLADGGATLGHVILQRRPDAFASMVGRAGSVGYLATLTIDSSASAELAAAVAIVPALAGPFLRKRPELAAEPNLWSRELSVQDEGFSALRIASDFRLEIIAAMVMAGRSDLAGRAVAEVGALEVLRALSSAIHSAQLAQGFQQWLRCAAQPNAVAELLARPEGQPRQLLVLLSRLLRPDDTPNDYGEDPWLTAVLRADGTVSGPGETALRAFLLARSLGRRSRNQAELARFGFEWTHRAAADESLPDDSWQWLDSRLPWPMLWFDWDRCQRLREGVAQLFIERSLSPDVFGYLVQDSDLFAALVGQAARTRSGRKYLKSVYTSLESSHKASASDRRNVIKRAID